MEATKFEQLLIAMKVIENEMAAQLDKVIDSLEAVAAYDEDQEGAQ